ncbi:hypothetical protein CVT25_000148, partial [Psilocybe cyanescens]
MSDLSIVKEMNGTPGILHTVYKQKKALKHIALTSLHTKIGRQTSSKTASRKRNEFFDSKVLSRQHAGVWEEGGQIYIKDVKSSNGSFIYVEKLSSEGHEWDPFELKSDDIIEFGIDIAGKDNKANIHHKVAASVVCVFTEQDAPVAAWAKQHSRQHQQMHAGSGTGEGLHGRQQPYITGLGSVGGVSTVRNNNPNRRASNFPFATRPLPSASSSPVPVTAPPAARPGPRNMGGIGLRPPGKTGLTFDVILSRLQGEVQKSRETGAELGGLMDAMGEVGDVLFGGPYLPPVRAPPPD